MKFEVYANNSFGPSAVSKFNLLADTILQCAEEQMAKGVQFGGLEFRISVTNCCNAFVQQNFKGIEFEYFFLIYQNNLYFVVNDIVKHPFFDTEYGKFIFYYHSNNFVRH